MDLKRIVLVMAMVSCFLLGSVASADADLIAAYTFDETSGATAADAVRGGAGEAILEGFDGSPWVDGVIGGEMDLDGVNDWMSAVNPIAQGATAMSFSGWVKADSRPIWSSIVKNWGGAQAGQYHFGLQAGDGDLSDFLFNTSGDVSNVREGSPFELDTWTHVAFTFDGSTHKLFKNGAVVAEAAYSGALNYPANQGDDGVVGFGVKTNDDGLAPDPGAPGFWDGAYDDFGFWSTALTDAEVQTIYTNGLEGISIVPEPTSFGLAMFGLVMLLRLRRRQ